MNRSLWNSALIAVSLAACSSNSSTLPSVSSVPQAQTQNAALDAAKGTTVTFAVVVPGGTAPAARGVRRPRYISPSTQSVVVVLGGTKLLTMNVDASSPTCKRTSSTSRTCSAKTSVPTGNQSFHVTAYDGLQGTGNVLATGTITKKIAVDAAQSVNISLTGKTASLAVALENGYPDAGSSAKTAVTLMALDADGNTIVGAYASPIRLSDSDTSGATKLSVTSVSASSGTIMLDYDGAPLASATISATAGRVPVASAVFAPAPTTVDIYSVPPLEINGRPLPAGLADLCLGPDGNMWATASSSGGIEKITPDGKFTSYLVAGSDPQGISVGSNHNLWFIEQTTGRVAQITTSGKITSYKIPVPSGTYAQPGWTAPGPDGRTWFVDQGTSPGVGAITSSGKMTIYPVPANTFPVEIVAGPDGNLWMTDGGSNSIDVVSTSGKFLAKHPLPTPSAAPWGITVGPDKNIWFAEFDADLIGRMTTKGKLKEFQVPSATAGPLNVASGPDGRVWFTESGGGFDVGGKIGYLTTDGSVIRDFPIIDPSAKFNNVGMHVHNLAFDKNNQLWFAQFSGPISDLGKLIY
jgi:streptogramin lyase